MRRVTVVVGVLLAWGAAGCGARTRVGPAGASGEADAGALDDGAFDGGADAAAPDAGVLDAGGRDASADAVADARPDASGGRVCTRDGDCRGGRLCRLERGSSQEDLAPALLTCGLSWRGGRRPGASCAVEEDCGRGLCLVSDRCALPCATDADCPEGQWCAEGARVRRGRRALQFASVCVDVVNLPLSVGFERRAAGTVEPSEEADVSLDLPGKEGSVLHVLWNRSRPDLRGYVFLWRLEDRADGRVLFDLDYFTDPVAAPTPLNSVSYGASRFDELPLLVPNGPATTSSPAGYRLWIGTEFPAPLERTTAWRVSQGDVLDLDVFYVGGGDLHPRGPRRGPPLVEGWIERVHEIFDQVSLRIGVVRHHDVVGGTRADYASLSTVDEETDEGRLRELFRLSAGLGRPSVPVFLVRDLGLALGVAANVPGAQGMHGRGASGLAIAVDAISDYAASGGETMAHEIGHFLGLFHTSEQNGFVFEALEDTPECRADRDVDGDGYVDTMECTGAGSDNLMFWASSEEEQSRLSPEQGRILRSSMVVR